MTAENANQRPKIGLVGCVKVEEAAAGNGRGTCTPAHRSGDAAAGSWLLAVFS